MSSEYFVSARLVPGGQLARSQHKSHSLQPNLGNAPTSIFEVTVAPPDPYFFQDYGRAAPGLACCPLCSALSLAFVQPVHFCWEMRVGGSGQTYTSTPSCSVSYKPLQGLLWVAP